MSIFDFDLFGESSYTDDNEQISYLNPFTEADDDGTPEATEDTSADTDNDGDLDVDTSLQDEDINGDGAGGDAGGDDLGMDTGDDTGGDTSGGGDIGGGSVDSSDEEPVKQNTDIFTSLTKEEQKNKIEQLKSLYENAYTTISDFMTRLDDIDNDMIDTPLLSRITNITYRLRKYTGDYITKVFPYKSYIENEATLVRITSIINSISKVIEEIAITKAKIDNKSN